VVVVTVVLVLVVVTVAVVIVVGEHNTGHGDAFRLCSGKMGAGDELE